MINTNNKLFIQDVQVLLESIGDGVLIVDNNGKVRLTNDALCELLGYKREEIIKKDALQILGAIDEYGKPINKRNAAIFDSIKKGKKNINAIRQFSRKDNERFWASITTSPLLHKNKKVKGGVVILRDITEKKLEEEYRSDFARVAGHNLRTPLGNVLWVTEHLLSGKAGKMTKVQKQFLKDNYSLLKQMSSVINDILSITNFQNKSIKPKKIKVDLGDLTTSIVSNLKYYARAKNLKINIEIDVKDKFFIKVDEKHVNAIVQNILENAIKYSFENTSIVIKIERQNGHVVFSCLNEGIGIPKAKQKYIFAKFFRASNAVDQDGDGTGLGLYTTHELVNLNEGKIWFESVPKKETCFFVKFKKY